MKIAFIGQKGIPAQQGGIEKHVENLSARLARAGFDVSVYARPKYLGKKIFVYKGVKIINLPSVATKNLDAITHTFAATIHALFQNYDVIHYHGVGPSLLAFIPRILKPKTKVVVTFHCVDRQHQKWGRFAKLMLTLGEWTACHFPHETIVVSETLKKYCEYRFDKETTYIPNGVEINGRCQNNKNILDKFGLKRGGYILAVARLVRHKGIHTLISAYQKSGSKRKLVIVGDGAHTDGYVADLKKLAQNDSNIVFTGSQTGQNLETLFKNARLFVQPSEAEGLSIALLEAMAYGLPIIASDIPENLEIVGDYHLTFKNKNAADLARQIKTAEKKYHELKKTAVLAKKYAQKKYNWRDIAKQTAKLYEGANLKTKSLKLKESTT